MGYTHYWKNNNNISFSDEEFSSMQNVAKELIAECDKRGISLEYEFEETPNDNDDSIYINGVGSQQCEGFYLTKKLPEFDFCKTRNYDYDIIVVALLIYIHDIKPEIEIMSDGDYNDWLSGLELLEAVLNRQFKIPIINYNDSKFEMYW